MAGSIAPVCVPCGTVMLCSKTGRRVLEWSSDGEPFRVHTGDEFACPECQTRVVQGFASVPIRESWQEGFGAFLKEAEEFEMVPYYRYAVARHSRAPLPADSLEKVAAHQLTDREALRGWLEAFLSALETIGPQNAGDDVLLAAHISNAYSRLDRVPPKGIAAWLASMELEAEREAEGNPREKGDDDGHEYGDPRDAREERRGL